MAWKLRKRLMRMDRTDFEQLVIEAIDSLPPEFARYLDNVEILIEPRPTADHRRRVGPETLADALWTLRRSTLNPA
jgi:Uncharacterized protein conserved in bacteria